MCQGMTLVVPQRSQNQRGLYRLRKNSIQRGFANALCQGMTLVVPQTPQNQRGLYGLRKNSIQRGFANALCQGTTLVVPQVQSNQRGLYRLRKNSTEEARSVRARLQSCRKCNQINVGFAGCGETQRKRQEVSGHDFSRAVSATESTWASAPAYAFQALHPRAGLFPQPVQPLRTLFRPTSALCACEPPSPEQT